MNWIKKHTQHLALAGFFLLIFFVYVISPVTTSTDSHWTLYVSASILSEHNLDLNEYERFIAKDDYRILRWNGHIYSYFPIGTPLLATPAVWIIDRLFPLRYSTDFLTYLQENPPNSFTDNIEKWIASAIVAASAFFLYLLARQEIGKWPSIFLVLIFAFSTSMYSTATRALWQNGPSALCIVLAIYLLKQAGRSPAYLLWTGFVLAFAYLVRPTNSIAILFFSLYILVNHRRALLPYVAGIGIPLGIFIVFSLITYHLILPPYYLPQRLMGNSTFAEALLGDLVSPARGLLVFSPVIIFSIYGIILKLKQSRPPWKNIDAYLAGILVAHWLAIASFRPWYGGWSIGPRFFSDMLPIFAYFLIPLFKSDYLASMQFTWKALFVATVAFGIFVNAWCSISPAPMLWNKEPEIVSKAPQRLWDWSDIQFLRGLCKNNPLENSAPACWRKGLQ